MNRVIFAVTVALLSFTAIARADDASKHAKARELLRLTYMEDRMEQRKAAAVLQIRSVAIQELVKLGYGKDKEKATSDLKQKLDAVVASRYDWNKWEPTYEQVYVDVYTEQELDGIIAFYQSPVGQAFLSKTPQITSKILDFSNQQLDLMIPEIRQIIHDYVSHFSVGNEPTSGK
jgi:hypothetical protein